MYQNLKPVVLAAALMAVCACIPKPVEHPQERLLNRLAAYPASGRIAYGHQDDLAYGHAWCVEDWESDSLERSDVKAVSGHYPMVVGFDLGGIELGDEANLDGVPFGLMRKAALTHDARGGIVTLSWHPRNPLTGGDAWDISSDQAVASVLEGGEKHELFLTWLDRVADFIGSLKDEAGNPVTVIFRPWHENVGSWFWWGGKLCTAEQYQTLFRMTADHIYGKGFENVLFCYSPNGNCTEEEYMARYPGDAYVHLLGVDTYEFVGNAPLEAASERYITELRGALDMLVRLSAEHKRMICLSETGLEGLTDPTWWTGTLYPAIKDYPICYVLTWRNAHDKPGHFYAPWPGFEHEDDFRAFAALDDIVML